jgi:hypothetical protein
MALGRKAWLFAGSDCGGERAASMYSLIVTAKLNDVDPRAWLADVLTRIGDHPASRLDQLLPWNWRAATLKAAASSHQHAAIAASISAWPTTSGITHGIRRMDTMIRLGMADVRNGKLTGLAAGHDLFASSVKVVAGTRSHLWRIRFFARAQP